MRITKRNAHRLRHPSAPQFVSTPGKRAAWVVVFRCVSACLFASSKVPPIQFPACLPGMCPLKPDIFDGAVLTSGLKCEAVPDPAWYWVIYWMGPLRLPLLRAPRVADRCGGICSGGRSGSGPGESERHQRASGEDLIVAFLGTAVLMSKGSGFRSSIIFCRDNPSFFSAIFSNRGKADCSSDGSRRTDNGCLQQHARVYGHLEP